MKCDSKQNVNRWKKAKLKCILASVGTSQNMHINKERCSDMRSYHLNICVSFSKLKIYETPLFINSRHHCFLHA